jgi:type II secretory pathway component GspD/PulD (secretin)
VPAFTVIRLKHAKAEQLAETLRAILPPGVTLVADPPTNSLIVSGPSFHPHQQRSEMEEKK